ncbi:MAG: chorismate synthase [Candidatus Zixiibacteriota bacterium]
MLRFLTAGESHGPALTGIIEGLPSGIPIDEETINDFLARRQKSHGRGHRMKKIEKDRVMILGGVRKGLTIGAPIALKIENKDWKIRKNRKSLQKSVPRPGHADLPGLIKYNFDDIQNVIERSSARETAIRSAVGAVAKIFLEQFGVEILGHTTAIGKVKYSSSKLNFEEIKNNIVESPVYCADKTVSRKMCIEIDTARSKGETLGGSFEVQASVLPIGLGSYVHWDRRLEGKLAQIIMCIPSVKAVEIGDGVRVASLPGSKVHDKIVARNNKLVRTSNRAGGIEGGMTNGQTLVVRGYSKPIASLKKPLASVNLKTGENTKAPYVRSDVCVVPAISVIAETMVAWVLAEAFIEKFGGDSLIETRNNFESYMNSQR